MNIRLFQHIIPFLLSVTLHSGPILAQSTENDQWQLAIKHRVKDDGICIRWAVNTVEAWQAGVQYGFIIERTLINSTSSNTKNNEKLLLTPTPLKPKPEQEWQSAAMNNDMAAVAAQAIYGDTFSVNNQEEESRFMQVINMASEREQRFGFSLYAMDRDFSTAQLAGFGFVDKDIEAGATYLYHIKLASPTQDDSQKLEYGFVAHTDEIEELPKPRDFVVYYYNDAFLLIWEYDSYLPYYNSYDIERSENGQDFTKINKVPITKLASTDVSGISYTDSIPVYDKKFWYRIKGHSYFNDVGPVSDTMSVTAYKQLLVAPEITQKDIISDKEVKLRWSFAKDEAWKVTNFDLLRADDAIGPYTTVQSNLSQNAREAYYNKLTESNYFRVRAKGIAGDVQDSSPVLIQPIDSIPPAQPRGLKGTVDTLGIVKISWEPNTELDLKGYDVFRSNTKNQEFTRLNKNQITGQSYTDTINIKSFNKEVLYRIQAVDNRYNASIPSDTLVMKRPNRAAPLSPLFSDYRIAQDSVHLHWLPSTSENIQKQMLFRSFIDQPENWEKIFETETNNLSTFIDLNIEADTKYAYTLIAVNEFGIESNPSPPLGLVTGKELTRESIKGIYAQVNRELHLIDISWRGDLTNVSELRLYRKTETSPFRLYETLAPDSKKYTDTRLQVGTSYGYAIQAIFNDGTISTWEEIMVTY
ncbi:fibronectin type III domain-containing protein [Cytophaga sp. FL35]|uniref:fibronectin type III domain-containing protein n=1 Tax=Cytophaga sp. FL35 TaxID=1904456 RepID=UPI001653ABA8|nr:fibronectin type III domain-containing protein [Cytophaga sp. FL35]MBC6997705.1 fibronectin type III domain-containing protein [Cytophaga sp. FL35]